MDGVAIATIARAASTTLEVLNLSWCVAVDDEAPLALGAHCPSLTWLSLHGNRNITDAGIDALSRGCLKLTSLDVSGCSQVTDYLRREGPRGEISTCCEVEAPHVRRRWLGADGVTADAVRRHAAPRRRRAPLCLAKFCCPCDCACRRPCDDLASA